MENKATIKQLNCIGALCSRLKISKESKEMIVHGYSEGRCTSSKDLTVQEALLVIQYLNEQLPEQDDKNKMIGKIFSTCHELAVLCPGEKWTKINSKGDKVANGQRFDQWAINNSYLKKKLNRYSYNELPKLVTQFEQVYKSFLKKY